MLLCEVILSVPYIYMGAKVSRQYHGRHADDGAWDGFTDSSSTS